MEGALGLESGIGSAIAHFAVRPWVSHCLSGQCLLLEMWSLKMTFKVLSVVATTASFIKCL